MLNFINQALGAATITGFAVIVVLIVAISQGKKNRVIHFFGSHAIFFSFLISLGALMGSLFYSEVLGYPPCSLCWYQRIFMFPIVIMLGMALYERRTDVRDYGIVLGIFGGVVAFYHTYLQWGGTPLASCGVGPGQVSCAQRFVFLWDFLTLPLMSLAAFLLIIFILYTHKIYEHKKN